MLSFLQSIQNSVSLQSVVRRTYLDYLLNRMFFFFDSNTLQSRYKILFYFFHLEYIQKRIKVYIVSSLNKDFCLYSIFLFGFFLC